MGSAALLAALLLSCSRAAAATPASLVLDEASPSVALWPAVMLLADPGRTLAVQDVLAMPERFAAPDTRDPTLGLREGALWLRVPLLLPARTPGQADPRWVLDIDYPALNRIDVHLAIDGQVVQQARLGNLQPFSQRPLASRTPALVLDLQPGRQHELLLRVDTAGALILPMTLSTPAEFHARALGEQMLQGLLGGVGLCLLLYSLAQWVNLRDTLFLKYALLITGSLLFSLFQFGVGAQYLWTDTLWIEQRMGVLSALLATGGSFLFVEHVLAGANTPRRFSTVMKAGAGLSAAVALAYLLDLLDVHGASAIVSVLGPVPALMGIPGALARARQRDPVGSSFLVAWAVYFAGTALTIGLINGHAPVNFWTLHAFQFGATLDMLLFMRVLGLRTQAVHTAALRATQERDVMHSLAHTDPLTGLPNRRGLHVQLTAALPHCTPHDLLALYLLDLDGFKPINDHHGHDVGDELLVAVGRRLQSHMRATDVVARLGGDEFVVMTAGLRSAEHAEDLGQQLLEAVRTPFELGPHTCRVGLTIGYVLAPLDAGDALDLLKRADAAMYLGKQSGKNCLRRGNHAEEAASTGPAAQVAPSNGF
ncbi:MAG TPA: diguanylate cyclase [Burkholderiaceae bacterium]|nr:diguanylate cyclase [Burkholderiaceae bacterium]